MIPTEREPEHGDVRELCCFCWAPTLNWTALPGRKPGEQVACCEKCARDPKNRCEDIPSKRYWCMMHSERRQAAEKGYLNGRRHSRVG